MLIITTLPLLSAPLIIVFLLVFSSIKPLRFEMLLLFIWFVSSKLCLCRKSITVSRTLFLFLGGWSLPLFLTKESLESCEFLLLSFSSAKNSLTLSFLLKSSVLFFISGMFGFRIDVNFRSLLKSSICFLDKGIPESLIFYDAKSGTVQVLLVAPFLWNKLSFVSSFSWSLFAGIWLS